MSHFLTVILVCLRTEQHPSEQTPTRRTSHRVAGAARAAWGRTQAAAWTLREARVVAPSGPRSPGGRNTARHWCSSLTTRTPTQWVITPPRLISFHLCCLSQSWQCLSYSSHIVIECLFDCFLSLCLHFFLVSAESRSENKRYYNKHVILASLDRSDFLTFMRMKHTKNLTTVCRAPNGITTHHLP